MQPLAVGALASGVVMIVGVTVTLILTRRNVKPLPAGINRWQLYGSIPLATAGLAVGVLSRSSSGQSPATHSVTFAVASTLLLAALLCALIGAATATRRQAA